MTERQVIAVLGRPDDVRTQHDPDGIPTTRTREVWCYGTDGHLTFPTLGCVYIDTDRKVQYVFGGRGDPPKPEVFTEGALRRLLRLIDTLPSYDAGSRYDPLPVIRVVNALLPLGKVKALGVIDEYLRVCSRWHSPAAEGIFLLLRVLFDVPKDPGYMPRMAVGAPEPAEPKDPKRLARFPILQIDDVPLLLVSGYMLGGVPEQPESHVAYFRKHGHLRARPLAPPAAPLAVFDRAWKSVSWLYGDEDGAWGASRGKLLLMNQLLRMVDSVYRRPSDAYGQKFYPRGDPDPGWRRIVTDVGKLGSRWDGEKGRHTFKDGTSLPDRPRKLYRREIWKVDGLNGDAAVIIQRSDERHVVVSLEWEGRVDDEPKPLSVQVYVPKKEGKPLAEFSKVAVGATAGDTAYSSQSTVVKLDEGSRVQVRVTAKGVTRVSPVYRP